MSLHASVRPIPYDTALESYCDTRRSDFEKALKLGASKDVCIGAWLGVQTLSSIVQHQFNHGPFPLHHPDLEFDNLLFDDEFNITAQAVIDWTHAAVVPIERLSATRVSSVQSLWIAVHQPDMEYVPRMGTLD